VFWKRQGIECVAEQLLASQEGLFSVILIVICPGCSVPEPYRLPDWVLVPAKTSLRAEY